MSKTRENAKVSPCKVVKIKDK